MQQLGNDEEEAAITLGRVVDDLLSRYAPKIRWGCLRRVLCNARAMGEFGALSVVPDTSGPDHTMPLHIDPLQRI